MTRTRLPKAQPASKLPNTNRALSADMSQGAIVPKKRRQLTSAAPQIGNPFAKLQSLVGNALRGGK